MKHLSLLFIITLIVGITSVRAQQLQVKSIQFARSVENHEPMGVDSVFQSSDGRIYCYTYVTGATDTTHISHVWYYGNEEKAKVELPVRSGSWHTWSSKAILNAWSGVWRVDVVDANGDVLSSGKFTVTEAQTQ